jgi:hypothetical protein
MDRVETLRRQLGSPRGKSRSDALSAAVLLDVRELAGDVLQLFLDSTDPALSARCVRALGHLKCKDAIPYLKDALIEGNANTRKWCAWALGEVGLDDIEKFLWWRLNEETNGSVKGAIGGALKKIRLDSVRAPAREVEKQLRPPPTRDAAVRSIVDDLQNLQYPENQKAIVSLRSKLKAASPEYFERYMDWCRRKPSVEEALQNPKKVYRDDEPAGRSTSGTRRGGRH